MPETPPVRRLALGAGYTGFLLAGAAFAMLGPALPGMRGTLSLTPATAGLVLSAHFVGRLSSTAAIAALERWLTGRAILTLAGALLAGGSALMAVAGSPLPALLGAALMGAGMNGIHVSLTMLIATSYGDHSAAIMNSLQAVLGIGLLSGPMMIGAWGPHSYRVPYAIVATAAACVVPALLLAPRRRLGGAPPVAQDTPRRPRRLLILGCFAISHLLFVGAESGIGGWQATHLISIGTNEGSAALLTGLFWAAVTVGRIAIVPVALRIPPERIVVWSLAAAAAALLLARVEQLAALAYVLAGLAMGPVSGTALAWLGSSLRDLRQAIPIVIAARSLGGIIFPPIVGAIASAAGANAIPVALAVLAAGSMATSALLARFERRSHALGRRANPWSP